MSAFSSNYGSTAVILTYPSGDPLEPRPNGKAWHAPVVTELSPEEAAAELRRIQEHRELYTDATPRAAEPEQETPGMGHNSGAVPAQTQAVTAFQQFEAIVDSTGYTAEQKCILVKVRCRVNAKTMDNAIVSNEGLMRAASLRDPRALRAELRELQGKARDLPEERDKQGRPVNDPIDAGRATIVLEERLGKASIVGFSPDRLHAIVAAYLQYREQKRGPGRPPASGAPPLSGKPPAQHTGGLSGKPPAPGTGGLEKPPASHAENPLRQTHPDPFPISGRKEDSISADARARTTLPLEELDDQDSSKDTSKAKRLALEAKAAFGLYIETAQRCGLVVPEDGAPWMPNIKARLRESGGLDVWKRMLGAVEASAFLCGENDRGFRADLDWLVRPKNFQKALSGKYAGKARKPKPKAIQRYGP